LSVTESETWWWRLNERHVSASASSKIFAKYFDAHRRINPPRKPRPAALASLRMASASAVARLVRTPWRRCATSRERRTYTSRWRVSAGGTGSEALPKSATTENRNPMCCILWDLDNVNPGVDADRAMVTARRLRDAASRLGGGALFDESGDDKGESSGPADVVSFIGFGNSQTLDRIDQDALRREGVDVRQSTSTPDAADMDLGAHVIGFAHAWATHRFPAKNIQNPKAFVTPRALNAARQAAEAEMIKVSGMTTRVTTARLVKDSAQTLAVQNLLVTNPNDDACVPQSVLTAAADAAAESLLSNALEAARAASAQFKEMVFKEQQLERFSKNNQLVLFVVTSDNDLVDAISYARVGCGAFAVVCGDFVPKPKLEGGKGQVSKRKRRRTLRWVGVDTARQTHAKNLGVTPTYWAETQRASLARPVGRLKLCESADAALVWDSTLLFQVEPRTVGGNDPLTGGNRGDETRGGHGIPLDNPQNTTSPGGVVGIWRKGGRGVGRWPSPRPAIPRE
jgi:hypothetical protein